MNELTVEETGLPLQFPDAFKEARARAEEFRRLSSDQRWQEIAALMAWGLKLARSSPQRAAIEKRWQAQEEEWQRIQQQLLVQHGK
jgi:hypothetical protein